MKGIAVARRHISRPNTIRVPLRRHLLDHTGRSGAAESSAQREADPIDRGSTPRAQDAEPRTGNGFGRCLRCLRAGNDVGTLISQLAAGGWLTVAVRDGAQRPVCHGAVRATAATTGFVVDLSVVLSKFAVLHRDSEGFILEHPLSWCDVRIHDARLLALLDGPESTDLAERRRVAVYRGPALERHARCGRRRGPAASRPSAGAHRICGSTAAARSVSATSPGSTSARPSGPRAGSPSLPTRTTKYSGEPIALPVPDLADKRAHDPTLTAVLEDRVSTRTFDDAHPITIDQLAELLYRTARTRRTRPVGEGEELLSRPYPSGGGIYELELYPVVRNVAGLEAGHVPLRLVRPRAAPGGRRRFKGRVPVD